MRQLEQWLEYIQSVHRRSIDLGLDRVRRVAHTMRLGTLPRVITIAGTNGKGSSVAVLESIYTAAGYRTGAYTSPHLVSYNERIRIQKKPADTDSICQAFERIERARSDIPLTYFEFGTLAALDIFAQADLDVVVLEVGMGGRLDAVNIVDADVAYIVSIGQDHIQWLGERREQIAREKAGILRYAKPVVCAESNPPDSIIECVNTSGAMLWQVNRDFGYQKQGETWSWWEYDNGVKNELVELPIPDIPGNKQLLNAAGVLTVVARMRSTLPITREQIVNGLQAVSVPGRLQLVQQVPKLILDVAHNAESITCLADYLSSESCSGRTLAIFAALADKPLAEIASIISPHIDQWFVAGLKGERGASSTVLLEEIASALKDAPAVAYDTPVQAYEAAHSEADTEDRIVVFGSFVTVGAIMGFLKLPVYR